MIDRSEIIDRAYNECLTEMYAKAQPSANFKELVESVKTGKINDDRENPIYERHYLSYDEFHYILNKYVDAYNIKSKWESHTDIVKDYFDGKGMKDIWVEGKINKDGEKCPGHRSSEEVPHIKQAFKSILNSFKETNNFDDSFVDEISNELSKKVFTYLSNCQDFYRFDREESSFKASIALGCSPTSNKKGVIEYWKKQGKEIEIIDKNPMLLWDMDYYGDEFTDLMIDEYGDEWEKKTWDEYYKSNDGKKSMVITFMRGDDAFDRYYIRNDDNGNLLVINLDDLKEVYLIDEFIKIHDIKGTYGK